MSAIATAALDDVLEVTARSIVEAASDAAGADRRAHARLRAEELAWLRQVRLKSGPAVRLIDLSRGGALIDSRVQLRPGSTVTIELTAPASLLELSSRVLRCELAGFDRGRVSYRGACMFTEPLFIEQVRAGAVPSAAAQAPAPAHPAAGASPAAWQKIVVRYLDGSTLKGYTLDFHPSRDHLSLWPSVNAARGERVIVPLARLKALFFVKDFAGDPARVKPAAGFEEAAAGRRIEVTFQDREVLRGTTLAYRPDGSGFFLTPADGSGNNQRVFVVTAAVRRVRFP